MTHELLECTDCKAERERRGEPPPKRFRKLVVNGIRVRRCASHERQKQRGSKAQRHDTYVQRAYGMSPGEYGRLHAYQGGVCYLCRRATGASRALSVDHDHRCCEAPPTCGNCTRGLLCRPCNDLLGIARDSVEYMYRAGAYLMAPPFIEFRRKEAERGDDAGVDRGPDQGG